MVSLMRKYGRWRSILVKKIRIDLSQLRRLGIDEIALRKGQGYFIVVLVDLDTHKSIAFVKSRKQVDIRDFNLPFPQHVHNFVYPLLSVAT